MITQTRIIEWYQHYDGKVYVSFSGGKDSTVLLDIARRIYPDISAAFIDTGLEYPEIREFVKTKENVDWLKPEMNFKKVIETYGYPVISKNISQYIREAKHTKSEKLRDLRINGTGCRTSMFSIPKKFMYLLDAPFECSEKCCIVMKKNPAHKYDKKTGKYPIIATMTDESSQRKRNWIKNGCNAFDKNNPSSQPMSFWTEQDVLRYLSKYHDGMLEAVHNQMRALGVSEEAILNRIHPWASVYGDVFEEENGKLRTTGEQRTGCVFCVFGCQCEKEPNRFQRLKTTHPKLHEFCMKPKEQGGLGMKQVLDYINVKSE
jgi:3'-phosphoadenosine 5'-phosphosulfate sulfotransferase (PAPS reductase)/FAD synthetase